MVGQYESVKRVVCFVEKGASHESIDISIFVPQFSALFSSFWSWRWSIQGAIRKLDRTRF